jgi:hypothetical protein
MSEQTKALRLADELEMWTLGEPAAAELRRLHALNGELLGALQRSRAQWIHSVNAEFCLAAIAKAKGT